MIADQLIDRYLAETTGKYLQEARRKWPITPDDIHTAVEARPYRPGSSLAYIVDVWLSLNKLHPVNPVSTYTQFKDLLLKMHAARDIDLVSADMPQTLEPHKHKPSIIPYRGDKLVFVRSPRLAGWE